MSSVLTLISSSVRSGLRRLPFFGENNMAAATDVGDPCSSSYTGPQLIVSSEADEDDVENVPGYYIDSRGVAIRHYGGLTTVEATRCVTEAVRSLTLMGITQVVLEDCSMLIVPAAIFQLVNLEVLSLNQNWLTCVDARFDALTRLTTLSFANNAITKISAHFWSMPNLHYLDLYGNKLQTFPFSQFTFASPKLALELRHNYIDTGMIPRDEMRIVAAHCTYICDQYSPSTIIPDRLFLGGKQTTSDCRNLQRMGVKHVLSVGEPPYHRFKGITYKEVSLPDSPTADISKFFPECLQWIEDGVMHGEGVLVHCMEGISRSVTIVCAYLMCKLGMTGDAAIEYVNKRRSCADPNVGFRVQLGAFDRSTIGLSLHMWEVLVLDTLDDSSSSSSDDDDDDDPSSSSEWDPEDKEGGTGLCEKWPPS